MQLSDRQIRVFASSTFQDMKVERNYLVKVTFPQLRKLCDSRGMVWGEVDLRCGFPDGHAYERDTNLNSSHNMVPCIR